MKTVTALIFVFLIALFVGCGGDGSSSSDASPANDNPVTSSYNYNSDASAARALNNEYVNTYKEIETKLASLKNDKTAFSETLDIFITQMMQDATSIDTTPSFAPRGDSKSLHVSVKDSKIDYSAYRLIGDINYDNSVDFDDVEELKDALYSGSSADMYDVNSDRQVDIKDLIDLTARLNTHIAFFDFYTTTGEKLNIATRTVDESKIVDYTGDESTVLVVGKDENMASSFTDTLSDLDSVWYKKSGWVYQSSQIIDTKRSSKIEMVTGAIDEALNITPSPYLIGWHFSVDYIETGYFAELDELGLLGMEFYLNKGKEKIKHYFRKSDMKNPAKEHLSKTHYLYHIGSTNAEQNEVKGTRRGIKHSFTLDGKQVIIRQYAAAFSVLYESLADKTLSGEVTKEPKLNGKITLKRVGPDKEGDFEGSVTDNKIEVKNLPYGEFTSEIEDACMCTFSNAKSFVFDEGNTDLSFAIDESKADVELQIVDLENNPLKDKEVQLRAKSCLNDSSSIAGKSSNSSGRVTFSNISIGDYEVYVDGKKVKDIHFCSDLNDKIMLNSLWKFHVSFTNPELGSGSMDVRKFTLYPNNTQAEFGTIYLTYLYTDWADEGITISYGGKFFADDGLSPLSVSLIGDTLVTDFTAMLPAFGMNWQIESTHDAWLIGAGGTQCGGDMPSGSLNKLKEGKEVVWSFSRDGITCNYRLEPCTDGECSD